jgi:hypothetical protein
VNEDFLRRVVVASHVEGAITDDNEGGGGREGLDESVDAFLALSNEEEVLGVRSGELGSDCVHLEHKEHYVPHLTSSSHLPANITTLVVFSTPGASCSLVSIGAKRCRT